MVDQLVRFDVGVWLESIPLLVIEGDAPACDVGQKRCSGKQWQVCNTDRTAYSTTPVATCTSSQVCDDADGCLSPTNVWAGSNHTCATMGAKNVLYCWGDNNAGELGNGTKTTTAAPSVPLALR